MTSRPLGLFDQEIRQRKLQALGDPLMALHTIVPWSIFRKTLESVRNEGRDPRKGSGPRHDQRKSSGDDAVLLVLCALYARSAEQVEYPIADRLSFQRVLVMTQ